MCNEPDMVAKINWNLTKFLCSPNPRDTDKTKGKLYECHL